MIHQILRIAAWAVLAFIIFATVSPIGLRPADALPVNLDRALAFLVATALFVVAYPRQALFCGALMVASSALIETLQLLSPTRHAHVEDALVKACGALVGLGFGFAANAMRRKLAS